MPRPSSSAPQRLGPLLAVYLLGIFMGAIDTGIITPARTIVQNDLGVDEATGIWMITIYTLAYAAAIPVMGKLADRYGRKPIYLLSIALFGLGSLFAGLSQNVGSFEMLIIARAVQAVGGGGIVPIATAEFGTSVPEEKRGLALGLVGGVYGVANIFGSSAGSLILDIFGDHNWQYIFYVNVPISIAIIIAGIVVLPNHRAESVARIDLLGITVLVAMIMSLLYGLRNIDYFNLATSLTQTDVYPFLGAFVVLLPIFILAERRAADPVLNLSYFTRRPILVTLLLAFISGFVLMGVVFVPQLAENLLRIPTGDGGYFVIVLGLASGIGAPVSGQLTDRFGPQVVIGAGLAISALAAAVGMWWAIPAPSWASVLITLALMGLGLGFVVGSPLNYMMLAQTPDEESNSALATLSLVRSIGTTIAPAFLVGFLAHAGTELATNLTAQLPTTITAPTLPYASQLQTKFDQLKADPQLADRLGTVTFPDLASKTTITINTSGGGTTLAPDLVELLKTADVTTIVERTKIVAERQFDAETPAVIADITDGVNTGLDSLQQAQADLASAQRKLDKAITGLDSGIAGMSKAATGMRSGIAGITKALTGIDSGLRGTTKALTGVTSAISGVDAGITGLDKAIAGQQQGLAQLRAALAAATPGSPEAVAIQAQIDALNTKLDDSSAQRAALVAKRNSLTDKRDQLRSARNQLRDQRASLIAKRAALRSQLVTLESKQAKAKASRTTLITTRKQLAATTTELTDITGKLTVLRDAVPSAFATAKADYLAQIDARALTVQNTFAATLNQGFLGIFAVTGIMSLAGLVLVLIYPRRLRTAPTSAPDEP